MIYIKLHSSVIFPSSVALSSVIFQVGCILFAIYARNTSLTSSLQERRASCAMSSWPSTPMYFPSILKSSLFSIQKPSQTPKEYYLHIYHLIIKFRFSINVSECLLIHSKFMFYALLIPKTFPNSHYKIAIYSFKLKSCLA